MPNYLSKIHIENHSILGNIDIDLMNPKTSKPFSIVVFVGENGCGKTTLLNELSKDDNHHNLFIRQNSMFVGAVNEIGKILSGSELYFSSNDKDVHLLKSNIDENKNAKKILDELGDDVVTDVFLSGKLDNARCAAQTMKLIDGKSADLDLDTLSSGQQEILLKIKELKQACGTTDYVLLDEPETSLHPRWQKRIVYLVRDIITGNSGTPQIFVATHSEKVLESIINNNDALIVRLYKNNNEIKYETKDEMNLVLPTPTFAELDYVIFKIDSFEYCSELYDLIEWKTEKAERAIDTLIRDSGFYDPNKHYKEWFNEKFGKVSAYTIATYCRNYFHHPKDREEPTAEQLHLAIELLRNVILNID